MTQSNDWHAQFQSDLEALKQRMDAHFDQQMQLNAEFRTRQEVLSNQIESLASETRELRSTAEALLQIAQVHQQGLERLTNEFRQHRSDDHGG